MIIHENFNLKKLNTFKISVLTKYYIQCSTDYEIIQSVNFGIKNNLNLLCLGGGSNLLFTNNFKGLVIHIITSGIKIIKETKSEIYIQVKAGENWDQFVLFCIQHKYGGVENLSLIPGTVGASPIQNIGAYGIEIKDTIISLNAIRIEIKNKVEYINFSNYECRFNYRDSYFKKIGKNNWIITDVIFKLTKKNHRIITSHSLIKEKLNQKKIINPTISNIRDIVKEVRMDKLPNLDRIGHAGSFFKNPIISTTKYNILKKKYIDLIGFKFGDNTIKVSAAFLIEKIGFKGFRINNYGVDIKNSLILVNFSDAKGIDILNFSNKIIQKIWTKFGIILEREVNVI